MPQFIFPPRSMNSEIWSGIMHKLFGLLYASKEIIEDLPRVMEKYGIKSLKEIIGGAH